MCLKIRCDGESEKICKIFWKLNKAVTSHWQLTLTVTGNVEVQSCYLDMID